MAAPENRRSAGISRSEPDPAAAFRELEGEVRRRPPTHAAGGAAASVDPRVAAGRLWAVAVEVPIEQRPGARGASAAAAKRLLRPLLRWYVAPFAAEQRAFNQSLLRLVDELRERVDALERRLGEPADDSRRP